MSLQKVKDYFRSRPRRIFVLAYVFFLIGSMIYSKICTGWFCETWSLVPAMPWIFMLRPLDFTNPSPEDAQLIIVSGIIGIIFNLLLSYLVGVIFEKLFRDRNESL